MKLFALDIGDVWTGTAISDALGMFAKPYQTTETKNLIPFLKATIAKERISTIIIGNPRTMKDTESAQTKKVLEVKQELETQIPNITWILWDERLSSKRAESLHKGTSKEAKIKSHSIAAAFILENYLLFKTPLTLQDE